MINCAQISIYINDLHCYKSNLSKMNKTFDYMLKIKDTYNVKNVTKSDMFKIFKILIDKYKYSYV